LILGLQLGKISGNPHARLCHTLVC